MVQNKILVAGFSLIAMAAGTSSAVNVTVDPGQTWLGYKNVFETTANGGGFVFGSPWGTGDLRASFSGDVLRLSPNTNCYNAVDSFWVNPDGSANKSMSANMYVENLALTGVTIDSSGKALVNSLASGYTSRAFIKVLDPALGYATIAETYVSLVGGTDFNLSLAVPNTAGLVPQYGFVTEGLVANPLTADQLGFAEVTAVPAPANAALLTFLGLAAARRRRA